MPQDFAWGKEYQNPQLLTKKAEPITDVKHFFKFLRKNEGIEAQNLTILDLGSGTGRNGNYFGKFGNSIKGLEISTTAVELARARAKEMEIDAEYLVADFGSVFPFTDDTFDVAIDVMSSNSLNEKERQMYLAETARVLKSGGYFFVKGLLKEGDKNAKNLLALHPGSEYDTYINEDMGLQERVFSTDDFKILYEKYFKILRILKKTNYVRFKGQSYKRNYFLAYLKKG